MSMCGEPSATCSWWLALPLALCPAPPCPLRVGLCLYALPVLPQEVRAKAGPTLPPLPFLESGAALPVHLFLARNSHLWRAGGYFGAGWGLELCADSLLFRLRFILKGFPEPPPAAAVTVGLYGGGGRGVESSFYFTT
ncbi:hypothetical protein mRhiFer1_008992 [Rhinolophus ferrumequinum]|uniref:Secreted protein n=1 Tax=Rhinolophus ferrumequinum TaxID=59479 RepID=A0A7J7TEU4_RHIFE|nr:hypothetical protein mRhiFer1_008992 [Rhinolophus ferrumequinum]